MKTVWLCACGAEMEIELPGPGRYFMAPPRCADCRAKDAAAQTATERAGAREFYHEHILAKAPAAHRAALEACEDVLLDAIIQTWRDAE